MKKYFFGLSSIVIVLSFFMLFQCINTNALTVTDEVKTHLSNAIALYVNSDKAYAKDSITSVDSNSDIVPVVKEGRTLVPVSFITNNFGASVNWDKVSQSIEIKIGTKIIKLKVGSKQMLVNDRAIILDVPAEIMNGRTFIPLSKLAIDVLDKKVFYDRGLIILSDKENILDKNSEKQIIDSIITLLEPSLFRIKVNKKCGFMNKSGKVVIKPQFDMVGDFSEGLAAVYMFDPKKANLKVGIWGKGIWGFIDKIGKVVIKPQFDRVRGFTEGLAPAEANGKWGYIDKNGKFVIPPTFSEAESFSGGLACVNNGDIFQPKWGIIDKTGKMVVEPQFDFAFKYSEGLAFVEQNGKYGYIDTNGNIVIPIEYSWAKNFHEGIASVQMDSGKSGYIDKAGKFVINPKFNLAEDFSEGLAFVSENEKMGVINKSGEYVIKPQFGGGWEYRPAFNEGISYFQEFNGGNGKFGYIHRDGNILVKPQFDLTYPFTDGLGLVYLDGVDDFESKWAYIDRNGNYIWKPQK